MTFLRSAKTTLFKNESIQKTLNKRHTLIKLLPSNLQEKYKEQLEEIAKNIQLLEQKRKDLDIYLTIKTNELNEKRNNLVREYFERM